MTFQVLEPVKNDKGKPCWLIKRNKEKPMNKSIKQIVKEKKPIEYEPIFELKPEGLWQCRRCGAKIQSTPNPPVECYKELGGCGRSSRFDIITKTVNTDLWRLPLWKDIPIDDIDMQGLYYDLYKLAKQCIVFVEDILYKIYALWIISTWKSGIWDTVCFPTFLGLINSGKSKSLDFIRETGFRMIHCSGVTFPAMVRASHFYNAGILLDEVQNKLNPRDEIGRQYIDFIKPSYRKGSKYTVADKEDQEKIISYNNFGFKAFAGEKGFDAGLMDRAIIFEMEQDYPEITNFNEIQSDFEMIRTRLLNYRYKLNEPELMNNGDLRGRTKEIYECIISTGRHIGLKTDDIIDYALGIEREKEEEFINTVEWEILNYIKLSECQNTLDDAPSEIYYGDILNAIGWDSSSASRLGHIFNKKFRLKTKRKTMGTVLLLTDPKNERKLKYLFRRYKV